MSCDSNDYLAKINKKSPACYREYVDNRPGFNRQKALFIESGPYDCNVFRFAQQPKHKHQIADWVV